ncbi:MAG: dTDP-4-dehydrorhamnose 3,5-epimerase family protein [Verrucomicrobiota bacterium]
MSSSPSRDPIDPKRDPPSVDADGNPLVPLPHGVTFRPAPTQVDERGWVSEIYNANWDWHEDPLVFVYAFTVLPGMIKGWGMHKKHEDRYYIVNGRMKVVMFDDRPDSPTNGLVSEVVLSHFNRRLMNIPPGIWHANWNIGDEEVLVVNCPTTPYDHANPDKYRLPLDTDKIPYDFPEHRGF